MRIRLKRLGFWGPKRSDSKIRIDSVIVKENLVNPESESVHIYFKGSGSSGILNFSSKEMQSLIDSLSGNLGLVKKKRIKKLPRK